MVDIDGFKLINDAHGHAAGGAVLVIPALAEDYPTVSIGIQLMDADDSQLTLLK